MPNEPNPVPEAELDDIEELPWDFFPLQVCSLWWRDHYDPRVHGENPNVYPSATDALATRWRRATRRTG